MSESTNVDPEDAARCFIELEEIDGQIARLRQKKGTAIARFEGLGVDVEAVRACQKLKRKDDAPKWMARLRRMASMLNVIPVEIESNGQVSLMPALPSQDSQDRIAAQAAFWAGWDAGRDGEIRDNNPHGAGSGEHASWDKGWVQGAKDKEASDKAKDAKKEVRKAAKAAAKEAERLAEEAHPPTQLEKDEAAYRGRPIPDTMPADPA